MHKLAFVLENEMDKSLWNFAILMHYLILTWKPDILSINKKKDLLSNGFYRSGEPQSDDKIKSEKAWRWRWYQL